MLDTKFIDNIVNQLSSSIPPGLKNIEEELRNKFKSVLQSAFTELDLVSREEFDVQTKVLARTRAKVDLLEQQIASMEEKKSKKK